MTAIKWTIFLLISLAALAAILDLRPAEDAMSLLPDGSRKEMELMEEMGLTRTILISLQYRDKEGETGTGNWQGLKDSTAGIGGILAKSPLLRNVHYRMSQEAAGDLVNLLNRHLPVLLDQGDLKEIEQRLAPARLREILQEDFRLLNSLSGLALKEKIIHDPLHFNSLVLAELQGLKGGMQVNISEGFFTSADRKSTLIRAESVPPLTNAETARRIHGLIREAVANGAEPGIEIRISGPLLHTLANTEAIEHDLKLLLPLATLALGCFLFWSTGSLRVFPVLAVPFLAAPPAIWFASLLYHPVSIMALGFGIVLLGLSVDFAIHIFLHRPDSPAATFKALRRSLLLAWLTSISCFGVLLFSSVPAHRQMALLAVAGISWALVLSLQLIPGMSGTTAPPRRFLLPVNQAGRRPTTPGMQKAVLFLWLLFITGGALIWPRLEYNGDLRTFDVENATVLANEAFFQEHWHTGEEMIFAAAAAPELEEALAANDALYQALLDHGIEEFQSLAPILPGPERQRHNRENWQKFWENHLPAFTERFNRASRELGFAAGAFRPFLTRLTETAPLLDPEVLLGRGPAPLFDSLIRRPNESRKDWLVLTSIPASPEAGRVAADLAEDLDGLEVLSNQSWRRSVEDQLRLEIRSLSLSAALIIVGLTIILFRRPRAVIAVLAPMLSALASMSLFAFFAAGGINLMHILMAIMVMGLSVDYGIFTVCNRQEHISALTSRAVMICAFSSLIGFGVLALARHPALHSLGITVLVGIGLALPTALWISPLLLEIGNQDQPGRNPNADMG